MRVVVARLLQAAGLRAPGQTGGRLRGLGYLSVLINPVRQRTGEQLSMQGRGRMVRMNFAEHKDHEQVKRSPRRADLLTLRERQIAVSIGAIAGGAGGYAVFASSNQAGTVVLLLISLIFLLVGVEGTPLLWHALRPGAHLAGKRRLDKTAQRMEPANPQLGAGMAEDLAMAEPMLVTRPAVMRAGADEGSSQ